MGGRSIQACSRQLQVPGSWRGVLASAIILGWVGTGSHQNAFAQDCSVEALGENSYKRVKQKIEERFGSKDDFSMDSYKKTKFEMQLDCVIHLQGRFQFRVKNQTQRKKYDARMTPKDGAPEGMEMVSYEIKNG